ncbi:MAG: cation diffusion facilitator family transporter [Gammaproteobacteria bacterium]|nr:cation diffusion facilitator family transporter [Gammaproteobacteria bacterium]MDH4256296.1 cation diffusion facilitator family transporter [Gammaproteobacteria bacterium]MDH5309359.1 cation diffusion facilitator family transporter [Gammaproteobacteria bacterium]
MSRAGDKERQVLRVILLEGTANLLVLAMKLVVGFATGSMAIFADALHSLTDVANNVIAWIVIRASNQPADREHPYGHRKFEVVAVFVLATLLATVAVELGIRAVTRETRDVTMSGWNLYVMIGVLLINIFLSTWQRAWAKRLRSQILLADASHTFADVLITSVVIVGWLLSVWSLPWLDTVCALGVSAMIMYLAFGLFRNVIPVLVDEIAIEPEQLTDAIKEVPGVIDVPRVRSRWIGTERAVDVIVTVAPALPTIRSHEIADQVERLLEQEFDVADISVHVEPHT